MYVCMYVCMYVNGHQQTPSRFVPDLSLWAAVRTIARTCMRSMILAKQNVPFPGPASMIRADCAMSMTSMHLPRKQCPVPNAKCQAVPNVAQCKMSGCAQCKMSGCAERCPMQNVRLCPMQNARLCPTWLSVHGTSSRRARGGKVALCCPHWCQRPPWWRADLRTWCRHCHHLLGLVSSGLVWSALVWSGVAWSGWSRSNTQGPMGPGPLCRSGPLCQDLGKDLGLACTRSGRARVCVTCQSKDVQFLGDGDERAQFLRTRQWNGQEGYGRTLESKCDEILSLCLIQYWREQLGQAWPPVTWVCPNVLDPC
jgi:hypothetical protein